MKFYIQLEDIKLNVSGIKMNCKYKTYLNNRMVIITIF